MRRVTQQLHGIKPITEYPVKVVITIYRGSNRGSDVGNTSIIEKYATDAIVQAKVLQDDSWKYIQSIQFQDGGLDKANPRAEYCISGV